MCPACPGIPARASCSQPEHSRTVEWSETKWWRRGREGGGEEEELEEEELEEEELEEEEEE